MSKETVPIIVTLEGPDYVGKTFIAKKIKDIMAKKYNREVYYFREPGTGKASEDMRDTIVNYENLEDYTQALLFTASRYEAFNKEIFPKLENGAIVIMDRSLLSTIVYQDNIKQILSISQPLLNHPMYIGTNIIMCVLDADTEIINKRKNEVGIRMHLDTRNVDDLRSKYRKALWAINTTHIPIWDNSALIKVDDDSDNNIKVVSEYIFEQIDNIIKGCE